MPNDHYVAQTYLKQFSNVDGRLIPYFKHKEKIIGKPKKPKFLCSRENWNTTNFLIDSRAIEKFLKLVENNWNKNISLLRQGECSLELMVEISAYLAYLRIFSPAQIRKHQATFSHFIPEVSKLKEEVYQEYVKAQTSQFIGDVIEKLIKSKWTILMDESKQFLTSDNPVCLYYPENNPNISWWYAAISTDMALIINPDRFEEEVDQAKFYKPKYAKISAKYRDDLNLNLVRNAEEAVFFKSKEKWIKTLVDKNKKWRSESINGTIGDIIYTLDRACEIK